MDNKRKVKILNSVYKKDLMVFRWHVKEINTGKEMFVVVPISDLINISLSKLKEMNSDILDKFCADLENKEIWLASEYTDQPMEELKGLDAEKMLAKHQEVDQFPCYEAYKIAEEENDRKTE